MTKFKWYQNTPRLYRGIEEPTLRDAVTDAVHRDYVALADYLHIDAASLAEYRRAVAIAAGVSAFALTLIGGNALLQKRSLDQRINEAMTPTSTQTQPVDEYGVSIDPKERHLQLMKQDGASAEEIKAMKDLYTEQEPKETPKIDLEKLGKQFNLPFQ